MRLDRNDTASSRPARWEVSRRGLYRAESWGQAAGFQGRLVEPPRAGKGEKRAEFVGRCDTYGDGRRVGVKVDGRVQAFTSGGQAAVGLPLGRTGNWKEAWPVKVAGQMMQLLHKGQVPARRGKGARTQLQQ